MLIFVLFVFDFPPWCQFANYRSLYSIYDSSQTLFNTYSALFAQLTTHFCSYIERYNANGNKLELIIILIRLVTRLVALLYNHPAETKIRKPIKIEKVYYGITA